MHLTLRHLQVFDAVMEAGSISRAAQRLNLSQPAVSIALSNLERAMGLHLFNRSRGYFSPTAEAQLLHGEAERSLLAVERFKARAAEIRSGAAGGVTLASNGASAINFLPGMIARFHEQHPDVDVDLKVRSSRRVAGLVAGGQIDIGLIDAPVTVAGIEATIYSMPCVCIMREDEPLASRPVITPADLAGRSIIGITGDHSIDRQTERAFAASGVTFERRITGSFFAIARNLVWANAGVAIIDCMNGTLDAGDGVVGRPFKPRVSYELALVRAAKRPLQTTAEAFLKTLHRQLAVYAG